MVALTNELWFGKFMLGHWSETVRVVIGYVVKALGHFRDAWRDLIINVKIHLL